MNEIEEIEYSQQYYHWALERYEEMRKILIDNYTRYHFAANCECLDEGDDHNHPQEVDPFHLEFHELLKPANNRLVARIESLKYHCQCEKCNLGRDYAMNIASEEYETTDAEIQESLAHKAEELNKQYVEGAEKLDLKKWAEENK